MRSGTRSLTPIGKPPPLAVRLEKALPIQRLVDDLLSMNREVQKKGDRHARVEEPIAREMVLQISHCVQPEIPKEGDVRKFEEGTYDFRLTNPWELCILWP